MTRAAVYCRVSTDHEDQANSFEAQQRYFRDYIERQDDWSLCGIFADEGITGTSTEKRTGFNRMIEAAKSGEFDIILTKEVSRFSRNILDTLVYTRELRASGIGVIFLTDGICTLDADAELRLSIMASIAQEESRKTSVRVKWGQTRQMERGVVFGHSMLGYDVTDGKISVDPDGALIVQRIFHEYVTEKKSAGMIAKGLDDDNIHTSSGGRFGSAQQILKILKNEKYTGDLVQKKTCTPDYLTHKKTINNGEEEKVIIRSHHEGIITHELWEAAQKEIEKRRRNYDNSGCSVIYPLSGKIRCGECGGVFITRRRKRADGTVYLKWGCSSAAVSGRKRIDEHGQTRGCDIGRMIRDDTAMEMLKTVLDSLEFDKNTFIESICMSEPEQESGLRTLKHSAEKIRNRMKILIDEYLAGNITENELRAMREKYIADEEKLDLRIAAIEESRIDNNVMKKTAERILSGESLSTSFWQRIIDKITIEKNGRVSVSLYGLDTVWYFTIGQPE